MACSMVNSVVASVPIPSALSFLHACRPSHVEATFTHSLDGSKSGCSRWNRLDIPVQICWNFPCQRTLNNTQRVQHRDRGSGALWAFSTRADGEVRRGLAMTAPAPVMCGAMFKQSLHIYQTDVSHSIVCWLSHHSTQDGGIMERKYQPQSPPPILHR